MRKSEVKKLKKNQIVYYGGYPWKFYQSCGYVNGIDKESVSKMDNEKYDGYIIILKAIDGKEYPMYGQYGPKDLCLKNQYWLGVRADYKKIEIKEEL